MDRKVISHLVVLFVYPAKTHLIHTQRCVWYIYLMLFEHSQWCQHIWALSRSISSILCPISLWMCHTCREGIIILTTAFYNTYKFPLWLRYNMQTRQIQRWVSPQWSLLNVHLIGITLLINYCLKCCLQMFGDAL